MGDTHSIMILVGFLIMLICQDLVAFKAFKKGYREGVLCAMVPGYILFYASRDETRQVKPVIGWLIGLAIILFGFMR